MSSTASALSGSLARRAARTSLALSNRRRPMANLAASRGGAASKALRRRRLTSAVVMARSASFAALMMSAVAMYRNASRLRSRTAYRDFFLAGAFPASSRRILWKSRVAW